MGTGLAYANPVPMYRYALTKVVNRGCWELSVRGSDAWSGPIGLRCNLCFYNGL